MGKLFQGSWIGSGLLILFFVPAIVYGAYSVGDRWHQNYLLAQQQAAIRADIERLRNENLRLQRDLEYARSDAAIEGIAREQLGLIRPGDRAIQLVGAGGAVAAPASAQLSAERDRPAPTEKPRWLRLLDAIFGR